METSEPERAAEAREARRSGEFFKSLQKQQTMVIQFSGSSYVMAMIRFEDALDVVLLLAVIGVVEDWVLLEVASSVVVVVAVVVEDWDPLEVAVSVASAVVDWDLFKVLVVCVVDPMSAVVLSGPGYTQIWSLAKFSLSQFLWNKCRNTWKCSILNFSLTGWSSIWWGLIIDTLIHSISKWPNLVLDQRNLLRL